MSIDLMRIRNFRSLADVSVSAKALTVFVGCNDEGKSNLLRALDLFFNSETRRYTMNWATDYSGYARKIRRKAPQIEITLTFTLPDSFSVGQPVVWKRIWRKTGLHKEDIKRADGGDLPARSKAYAYLKTLRYEYIPAIKGTEYFEKLLGSVHDMLDTTVQSDIRAASANFTKAIRSHIGGILHDLENQLGLKSDLELPSDLRRLFTELEFRSDAGNHRVALSQRGDGIKVRHIPIILHWLAHQANHLSAPGRPRVETIWGYEEPENNLETRRCFELAEFFLQNSGSIQTFLTTHSPVFYSVLQPKEHDAVSLAEVRLGTTGTEVVTRMPGQQGDMMALHSSIGFLELIGPHVREWKEKNNRLEERIEEGIFTDQPTIFVEGPSDKAIIEAVITRFSSKASMVKVLCSERNGGGHSWVSDSLIAWHHSRPSERAVGLFDGDDASQPSLKKFIDLVEERAKGSTKAFKYKIKPAGISLQITQAGVKLQPAIEEICPAEVWKTAERRGWLEDRPNLPKLYHFRETDITFNDWLTKKLREPSMLLIARKKVFQNHKRDFANEVVTAIQNAQDLDILEPLQEMVSELLSRLNINIQ